MLSLYCILKQKIQNHDLWFKWFITDDILIAAFCKLGFPHTHTQTRKREVAIQNIAWLLI